MRLHANFHIIFALVLTVFLLPASTLAYSGVISVDTVEALPGEQVEVAVRLSNNDKPISALTIPLKYSSPYLSVDSISLVGSILPSDFSGMRYYTNIYVIDTIRISYIPDIVSPIPVITTSGGIVATIFFSVSPSVG
ncbi:MAG: cohesin domain-containing protein, partial [Candidatus Zixiibacteriota bacterium]